MRVVFQSLEVEGSCSAFRCAVKVVAKNEPIITIDFDSELCSVNEDSEMKSFSFVKKSSLFEKFRVVFVVLSDFQLSDSDKIGIAKSQIDDQNMV